LLQAAKRAGRGHYLWANYRAYPYIYTATENILLLFLLIIN